MAWLLLLASLLPQDLPVRDRCDLIELNHVYGDQGTVVTKQVIFWDWHPEELAYHVCAFRLVKIRDAWVYSEGGEHVARWMDLGTLREVRAPRFWVSRSNYDPEQEDRKALRLIDRRGLTGEFDYLFVED